MANVEFDHSLHQYVTTNNLPCRVKVTEGYQDPHDHSLEFSTGDVIDLHKIVCPTVGLHYYDSESGEKKHMSVSVQCACLFQILPYIPDKPVFLDRPIIVESVRELVNVWPSVVSPEKEFRDAEGKLIIEKGEKVKLKRLIMKDFEQFLECRIHSKAKLVNLPMTCDISFKLLTDRTSYNLLEITEMPGRVQRRIHLSDDMVNMTIAVPGLPVGFSGDLFMNPPQRFVEVSPADSPGFKHIIPLNTPLSVAARDEEYASNTSFTWYPLDSFVEGNGKKLPMVVQVIEWTEEPISLQAIRVSIGDRMVLHHLNTITKVACEVDERFYSIPKSFDGVFRIMKRIFNSIEDVCRVRDSVKKVRVLFDAHSDDPSLDGVRKGDILEIGPTKIKRFEERGRFKDEIEVVTVWKNERRTPATLPLYLQGMYEEIVDYPGDVNQKLSLSMISAERMPLNVELVENVATFAPSRNPIKLNEMVKLLYVYEEPCIVASKDAKRSFSCPVPLHTGVHVRYVSKFPKTSSVPETSTLATCPQDVSEDVIDRIHEDVVYQEPTDSIINRPKRPPRSIDQKKYLTLPALGRSGCPLPEIPQEMDAGTVPPRPARPQPTVQRSVSSPDQGHHTKKSLFSGLKKNKSDRIPAQTNVSDKAMTLPSRRAPPPIPPEGKQNYKGGDDELEYEDVSSVQNYGMVLREIFGHEAPPTIQIPGHGSIQHFSWRQMVALLQITEMPPQSLRLFATDKISGKMFSQLDNEQLSKYGVNHPLMRHFRSKSQGHNVGVLGDVL